jgi:osmotically-inducible protein OsmY
MRIRIPIALALLWIVAGLAAAQQKPKVRPPTPPKSDAAIEADIRQRFAKSKSKDDHFTVKVRNGIATLEGKTSVLQRKGSATRMAKTAGAKQVNNLIQVSDAAKKKAAERFTRRRVGVTRSKQP